MKEPQAESRNLWAGLLAGNLTLAEIVRFMVVGFIVGAWAGVVVSVFRITSSAACTAITRWAARNSHSWAAFLACLFVVCLISLWVGRMIRNPDIRSGAIGWIQKALKTGQPRVWQTIFMPKFVGSWLVKACGVSVGMEGPSVQIGSAAALGLQKLTHKPIERRFFMLGGGAAGLATAFSAPFAGICYVYETLQVQMSRELFAFLLAGSFGVYFSCIGIFGLDVLLPFTGAPMPGLGKYWLLILLACFAALCGIVYNYLLRASLCFFDRLKFLPILYHPLPAFALTAVMLFVFPAATGEGMGVFPDLEAGTWSLLFLCALLVVKLLLTAWCYGTSIPAGQMVPVLCIGGIAGAIFSLLCQAAGLLGAGYHLSCITIGMAGAFSASERAPITGIVLVAQMTGAWSVGAGLLLAAALGTFLARLARVRTL